MIIHPIDREQLRAQVRQAQPFPHFKIDSFLESGFADEVERTAPSFEQARQVGRGFNAVNERNKIQITDPDQFPEPFKRLNAALSSPEWLELLGYVMDIPDLVADPTFKGGGIHVTGARGHLDVHVDFNYMEEQALHRRLNILIYLNKNWEESWGGNIELWDEQVKRCHHSFSPIFNRCVVFETNDISYHGVTAVRCPETTARKSFAAYYYTQQPPQGWDGTKHSTLFRARPDEKLKSTLLMPGEKLFRGIKRFIFRR